MSKSFKEQTEAPPVEFRTPSPPLRFCEAISPDFSEYLRRTPPAPEYEQITPERINGFEQELDGLAGVSEECRRYGNSDLEDSRLPRQFYKTHNQSTTIQSSAHTRDWSKSELDHDDRAREEAELLLNFTREAHLAIPKVPPAIPTSNPRSASFNSYIQTRPSVSDLQSSLHMREQKYGRPTTQNGTRSIWKEEVLYPPESPRRASYYDQVLDNPRESPPPELQNKIEIASTMGVAPATRFDSVEMKEEKVEDTTKAIDPTTLPPIHTSGETRTAESSISMALETPALMMNPALQKKNQDIPSICASCNFARNTNDNEADSDSTSWISCDGCRSWFHFACAGFKSEREVRAVDKFRCKNCKPVFGATTYVRKSSRAHTSIDYAGLNEGVIKTSDADPEHHYVKDFKNGKKFTPETFARMRPELVTAKFFELGDGMKEPIVIPAALNPRPNPIPTADLPEDAEDFETEVKKYELLHDRSNLEIWTAETFEYETVQDQGQDALDMVIPRDLTVRRVAELYGVDEKLEVIDVKSQNGEDKPWTLQRWADYYESSGEKVVRNVISLEVSQSRLGRLIRRPKIVRDLDLQDSVWPSELQAKGEYPKVQFYCLMSVADCYTDFHIDFGGSSVYYHILRGKKTFFFIPPTEKHLKQYEEWCNSPAQNWTFLGDQTNQCYRVDLFEGDTMLIPAGWIHAVWTPADSLVIGGNFLTRLHYPIQIRVAQIEKATNVARKFRYPHFQKLLWYAAVRYMDEDPMPESMVDILHNGQIFERSAFDSEDYDAWGEYSPDLEENYQARYYPRAELEGLPELCRYLLRTALIATGNLTEGISTEIRNAIKRSMPKGHNHGKPFEAIKKFALWCAWKRGNETIPYWAYPNYIPEDATAEGSEKNLSTRARKKLDHDAANQAFKIAPDRQSTRPRSQPQNDATACEISKQDVEETTNTSKRKLMETVDSDSTLIQSKVKRPRVSSSARSGSGRKTACEACRKSRRACKHGKISRQDSSSDTSLLADVKVVTPIKVTASEDLSTNYASMIDPPDDHHIKSESNGDRMILDTTFDDQSTTIQTEIFDSPQTKLSGRTKACKDCRKSKVRISLFMTTLILLTKSLASMCT